MPPTPPSAEAYNNHAQAMMRAGRFADAVNAYRAAINLRTAYPEAHFGLANAFAALGRYEEAAAAYQRTIPLTPGMPQPHNNLGSTLMALGRTAEAITAFRAAIAAADDKYPEAYYNLGLALAKSEKWDDAMAAYQQALSQRPRAEIHNNIGIVHSTLGRLDEAVAAFRAALALQASYPDAHYNLGAAWAKLRRWDEAAAAYRQAIALRPGFAEAHNNLGSALLELGRPEEAVAAFRATIAARNTSPDAHYNLGEALSRAGRHDEAIVTFRKALDQRPNFAEAHNSLGIVLSAVGRTGDAVEAYRTALISRPAFPEAYSNLGIAFHKLDRGTEAVAAYREAIRLRPDFAGAHHNLSIALYDMGRPQEALEAARRAVDLAPGIADHHIMLGNCLREGEQQHEAIKAYRRMLETWPEHAEALSLLANIFLLTRGRFDPEAGELLRKAARLRPLARRPANKAKADFSVLLINAPGIGNTPVDFLVTRANYDCAFVALLPGLDYDVTLLRANGDVVVNLVSDVDWGREALPQVSDLIERLGRPVINHPRNILKTGRELVAGKLAGIAKCRTPKMVRGSASYFLENGIASAATSMGFPLLVRVAGTHGGEDFEKFDDTAAVAEFIARNPRADHYISEYVPYESADGYFRKYRFIVADGRLFPYHLAIGRHWKVHHASTDMENQEWMRKEEEAFMRNPAAVFGPAQWQALVGIQQAIGLDYFGIDCALDAQGNVLVFEANATMLVHGERAVFAYKQPYILRIKEGFDTMLAKAAQANRPAVGRA